MTATWSLPDFVGMAVSGGGDCTYQSDFEGIRGVQYVRRMSLLASLQWEYYVAADPELKGEVLARIAEMPGVDNVRFIRPRHRDR